MSIDSVLVYHGGKAKIADTVISHFPRTPTCYVEPFVGGGGIYFNLPDELYPVRVINDINTSITTFFRVLRTRPDELIAVCELTPYSFDEQRACRKSGQDPDPSTPEGELEMARRVWVRQRQNFAGRQTGSDGWKRGSDTLSPARIASRVLAQMKEYANKLRMAEINNTDAIKLIEDYTIEGAFMYMDPPYVPESRNGDCYEHEMTCEDHEKLCDTWLKASEAGVLIAISGYDNELYNTKLSGWRKASFTHTATSIAFTKDKKDMVRTEVLWMNYPGSLEIGQDWRPLPKASNSRERALMKALRAKGYTK